MKLYTIGFTKKSAQRFFTLLSAHGVKRLIDIRLNPGGQLAGFAKQADLAYFLDQLAGCEYIHMPALAPTGKVLSEYRQDHDWERYTRRFEVLMEARGIPATLDHSIFEAGPCCLLCSEATPEQCHRLLVAERLAREWQGLEIEHL